MLRHAKDCAVVYDTHTREYKKNNGRMSSTRKTELKKKNNKNTGAVIYVGSIW